mmetsp:Transcript_17937/g.36414  ORF Transcript_17937/g.36414 Transcript_17937/m.36414 type:complete len:815 (+) Transcript_17937:162-2606(+)
MDPSSEPTQSLAPPPSMGQDSEPSPESSKPPSTQAESKQMNSEEKVEPETKTEAAKLKPEPNPNGTQLKVSPPPVPLPSVAALEGGTASCPVAKTDTDVTGEEEIDPIFVGKTCTQCRIAKVKCDKHQPCARCIRRNYECCAQERGPGRPPTTAGGSKQSAKKASKSSLSSRKAKRRRGKQAKEEEPHPEHDNTPGFPSQGPMPGPFPMQYVVPHGFAHPKAGGPFPPQIMGGPVLQQHPIASNSNIAQQFISKVSSGLLNKDKIKDVIAYLSDLAVKRRSSFLAQKVLEAISASDNESMLTLLDSSPRVLPVKQLELITTLSKGLVDPQDEAKGLLVGKPSRQASLCTQPIPAYISEFLNDPKIMTSQRITTEGETTFFCNDLFKEAFFDTEYAEAMYLKGTDAWRELFERGGDYHLFNMITGGVVVGVERRSEYTCYATLVDNKGQTAVYSISIRSELSPGGHSAFHAIRFSKYLDSPMSTPGPGQQFIQSGGFVASLGPAPLVMHAAPQQRQGHFMPPSHHYSPNPSYMYSQSSPNDMQQQRGMEGLNNPFDDSQLQDIDVITSNARIVLHVIDLLTSNSIGPIIELCVQDVFVDSGLPDTEAPLLGTFIGKRKVAQYFSYWHEHFVLHIFSITDVKTMGNSISCVANYQVTSKKSGVRSKVIIHKAKWIFNDSGKIVGIHMYVNPPEIKALFAVHSPESQDSYNDAGASRARLQRDSARDWRNMIANMGSNHGGAGVVKTAPARPLAPVVGAGAGAGEEDLFSLGSNASNVSGLGSLLDNLADDSSVSPLNKNSGSSSGGGGGAGGGAKK